MADFKFPDDGTTEGEEALTVDKTIFFPKEKLDVGVSRTFEIKITGATALDTNVSFEIFSGLDISILDASNIIKTVEGVNLTGLTGNLGFQRHIVNTLDTAFKVVITGTSASSTATFLIRTRAE